MRKRKKEIRECRKKEIKRERKKFVLKKNSNCYQDIQSNTRVYF